MKYQNPSLNSVLNGRKDERTDERTSRKQYAPHFFKVGGIKRKKKFVFGTGFEPTTLRLQILDLTP